MTKPRPDTMDGVNPADQERPMAGDGLTRPEGAEIAPPGVAKDAAKDKVVAEDKTMDKDKLPPPPEGDLSM